MTSIQQLYSNICKHVELTADEWTLVTSVLQEKKVARKEYLLEAGQRCQSMFYVNKGALRAFYQTPEGKEATIMFAIPDWWITDMPCFVNKSAAMITIEAIEESHVLELFKDDLEMLFLKIPKMERFFRILMQNAYVREQLRVLQNLSLPSAERYANFIKKYPSIAQQVAQKDIASYLGITPEFLSAIRSKRTIS